jgi:hypothetical protein
MATIAEQMRRMGFRQEIIDGATVDGKPLCDVPGGTTPKSRLPERMNKTEALYAVELEWERVYGRIIGWQFGAVKLRLADKTWYTPDFLVQLPDGRMRFVEIKGWLRDDAAVKFKCAREQFPWAEFLMLRRVKKRWVEVNI